MASEAIGLALSALYEAATTPDAWPDALSGLARATHSVGCRFRPVDPEPAGFQFPASLELGGFLQEFQSEGWALADPRTQRGVPLVKSGRAVVLEHDIATDDERRRSPFYQTLLRRHDLPWWAAIAFSVDGSPFVLSILRSAAQGAFMPADARSFADIAPRLRNIVSVSHRFAFARGHGAVDGLERAGRAALILDNRGDCRLINTLAERMMGLDLIMTRGRLHAADRASDQRLQDLISRAVVSQSVGSPVPDPVFVRRREGRPYMVEAFPANDRMRDVFRCLAVLAVITDLGARPNPPDRWIREAFGLTPAEARLAARLGSGEDLRDAAERLGVAYETARAQLKAIFGKARVSRQSEFMALLAGIGLRKGGVHLTQMGDDACRGKPLDLSRLNG